MHDRLKATIVYVTHDQIEAMTLGSKIAVMQGGEIRQFGSPREIYDRPADLFVAGFIGSPAIFPRPCFSIPTAEKESASVRGCAVAGCNGS